MSALRSNDPGQPRTDLRELVDTLVQRWRFIAAFTLAVLLLALAYVLTATPIYTATVSILIDARPRAPLSADAQQLNATPDAALVESQVKLFSSDAVLRRVVQSEKLYDDPEFVQPRLGLRARLFALLGLSKASTTQADLVTGATQTLARSVTVRRSERTYVVDVDVSSLSPEKAARLANAMAAAYVVDQQQTRESLARRDTDYLTQRIGELQARVQEGEARAQQFRSSNGILDVNGKNLGEQVLSDLTGELGRARARVIETKTRVEQIERLTVGGRAPDAIPDIFKSNTLDKLRSQYADIARQDANLRTTLGARHPALLEVQNQLRDTRRLIDEELTRIARTARNDYQLAQATEAETQRNLQEARRATDAQNRTGVQLNELQRDVDASRVAYERLLRARDAVGGDIAEGPFARVIAPASQPAAPSAPKSTAILFVALAAALFVSAGMTLLFDYFARPHRRRAGDFENEANGDRNRVIASLPRMNRPSEGSFAALRSWMLRPRDTAPASEAASNLFEEFAAHPTSPFSDGILDLYAALIPRRPRSPGRKSVARTVLVTSARAGCGKSTIAVNLARAAAAAGQRTLLIDGNPANPSLSSLIAPDAQPGLIDLSDETRLIYTIAERLHLVPIVAQEAALRERLARRPDTARIHGILDSFDFVVIDGPATEVDRQAHEVAAAVDRVTVVTTMDRREPRLEEVLEALDLSEPKFAGTVMSMVDTRQAA